MLFPLLSLLPPGQIWGAGTQAQENRRQETAGSVPGQAVHCHHPHPLPLGEAQDEGLPIAGSVVTNTCGERDSPGWESGRGDSQEPPAPHGSPVTHPSAGWCWAQ